jgi:hypothetical protein
LNDLAGRRPLEKEFRRRETNLDTGGEFIAYFR